VAHFENAVEAMPASAGVASTIAFSNSLGGPGQVRRASF